MDYNLLGRSGRIRDPTSIQLLFEISRTLHDNMESINAKNDDSQVARSVSRFVQMVTLTLLTFFGCDNVFATIIVCWELPLIAR